STFHFLRTSGAMPIPRESERRGSRCREGSTVSEPWRPSLGDICTAFRDLADEVGESHGSPIDPGVEQTIRHLLEDLELFLPGLDPMPDTEAAQAMARAAMVALERGGEGEAVVRALRGLSFSPHDPRLHYLLSSARFVIGRVE